jgi:hypothetical protein
MFGIDRVGGLGTLPRRLSEREAVLQALGYDRHLEIATMPKAVSKLCRHTFRIRLAKVVVTMG